VGCTRLATISTDTHHASLEFRASVGAHWPFLEDPALCRGISTFRSTPTPRTIQ
jgi:hypothetical protein